MHPHSHFQAQMAMPQTQIQINFLTAVAVATRRIKTGMEVHDSYGAVWYHMDRTERQRFLKVFFFFKK